MIAVRSTISAPDGTWRIEGISENTVYFVVGFDAHGLVNAAIQDWVRPFVPEH